MEEVSYLAYKAKVTTRGLVSANRCFPWGKKDSAIGYLPCDQSQHHSVYEETFWIKADGL